MPELPSARMRPETLSRNEVALLDGGPFEPRLDTLQDRLYTTAHESPDSGITYVYDDGKEEFQSYGSLIRKAETICRGLETHENAHPHVILQFAHSPEFVAAFWGCLLARRVPV